MGPPKLEEVYDQYVSRVHGFFLYRLGSREDAEDLTQVTFERAARAFRRYDPRRGNHLTWLLAIARNVLVDHFREGPREPPRSLEETDLEAVAPTATPLEDLSLGLDVDLAAALSRLGEREREIIGLRYGADLSGSQIATLTGLSLANVQQILSRSVRRLRDTIEQRRLEHTVAHERPGRRGDQPPL